MMGYERGRFEENPIEAATQHVWESAEIALVRSEKFQDSRFDSGRLLSCEVTRTVLSHPVKTDGIHVVHKMINGSVEIVHQDFDVFFYLHIATKLSLETTMTKSMMVLLEGVDSVDRQLEAHLLRLDEVDVEHLRLNVNTLTRSCAFVWVLDATAWQHDGGQVPHRFGTTQQVRQDLSLPRI